MHLTERLVATFTYVVSFFSLSGVEEFTKMQKPLFSIEPHNARPYSGPIFKPPTGRPNVDLPGGGLNCDYSAMGSDWAPCSTPTTRCCWLRNAKTGEEYNIHTDYEDPKKLPKGIDRYYTLNLTDGWINADGMNFTEAKLFWNTSDPDSRSPDGRYPGPWVQACWGDKVHINVINGLRFNGTSVHWHGIRQLNTTEMDGVPGITQCPIAPRDNFTYSWTARQYGSSWYHSHFSLQYADGALGPMTIHGPTSDNWDEPKFSILMTDWGHNSAFQAIWPVGLINQSTLLNGKGNVTRYKNGRANQTTIHDPYSISVSSTPIVGRARRYLLQLINTSFESHFIFTIDNHEFMVISTDFVAVKPYPARTVAIGIGQRYNVVLIAQPIDAPDSAKSFWMRTYRPQCFNLNTKDPPSDGYEKAGIVFYDGETRWPDRSASGWPVDTGLSACADELYSKLHPVFPWTVGKPPAKEEDGLSVQLRPDPSIFPLALFSIGGEDFNPLQIDYSNPIFLRLGYTGKWNPRWVVYPEDYNDTAWVYLVLKGGSRGTFGAHPIHLHGHDFAILEQVNKTFDPKTVNLNLHNPPRRDVVLLPSSGYAVIAFRTDNPGPWIMHCHIAQHASFGLALQVLERQGAAFSNAKLHGPKSVSPLTQAQDMQQMERLVGRLQQLVV